MIKNRGGLERLRGAGVLLDALEAALAAADPYGAVVKYVKRSGNGVEVTGRRYELSGAVRIVGFGKVPLRDAVVGGAERLQVGRERTAALSRGGFGDQHKTLDL